ncbi:hypothetical protein RhiirC2_721561 [Rhizophagus irregularis]|uniref:Uncharacterized protein n=1 Tax=Rhizophagus irregularis TaxID=588596 RepID=A0A2N1M5I9_9GLOM|nr:hypothetical protein RhiirC2_721561 [Rhizophagus irregularis]
MVKLWKQHEKAEAVYDRAVEKKEKAGDALGQLFEKKGIENRELRELEWKAYHKACEERTKVGIEHEFLHVLRPIFTFETQTHLAIKMIFSHIQDIWYSGTQLVYKTSNPQTILGSFNAQL